MVVNDSSVSFNNNSQKEGIHNALKVAIVCVCYNAHDDAGRLLKSIELAFSKADLSLKLNVVLSDNSNYPAPNELINKNYTFDYSYVSNDNIGYFPGFNAGIKSLSPKDFDYIIISNVDLIMSESFFVELINLKETRKVGVIAPAIISLNDSRDLNPKIVSRPSRSKLTFLKFIFSWHYLYYAYRALASFKECVKSKEKVRQLTNKRNIYAPHGSFIIFTKEYFQIDNSFDYTRFLFGEEVFVGEMARINDLAVEYNPKLIINDVEHGSTSLVPSKFLSKQHVLSYEFLINKFFN